MKTWTRGWEKRCKICGGRVRYVENIDNEGVEWLFECVECGRILYEEQVEFREAK